MACRLPGRIHTPDDLWLALERGADLVGPTGRPGGAPGPGAFLDEVARFDAAFFGIAPREAEQLDPQQRILLELAWDALERAGIAPDGLSGTSTGVWTATGLQDYARSGLYASEPDAIDAYSGTGTFPSVAAGRIAYQLGLRGPAIAVDTACSSALVALHQAVGALRSGEVDRALVGAANLLLAPEPSLYFSRLKALSPTGRCWTFDARADGYVRSEGAGVLVLERLSDAIEARRHVHAVVRGTALNHDGRTTGLTAPSGRAQQAVLRAALADAGLEPADIGMIEAHGTGTPLGDPVELAALAAVYGARAAGTERPCRVGSVKTNLGHLEAASGLVGLLKAALSVERGIVPAHLHLRTPNPRIAPDPRLRIPTEAEPFGPGTRRASVSAFGLAGTNAHVVLEQAPSDTEEAAPNELGVLPIAGATPEARALLEGGIAAALRAGVDWASARATQAEGRAHLRSRRAVVAASALEAAEQLDHRVEDAPGPVGAVVLVLGADPGDVGELSAAFPVFAAARSRAAAALSAAGLPDAGFAAHWALCALLGSWGIEPDAIVGAEPTAVALDAGLELEAAVAVLGGAQTPDGAELDELRAEGAVTRVEVGALDVRSALQIAADLYARGADLDWSALAPRGRRPAKLPTTPWAGRRYWHRAREAAPAPLEEVWLASEHGPPDPRPLRMIGHGAAALAEALRARGARATADPDGPGRVVWLAGPSSGPLEDAAADLCVGAVDALRSAIERGQRVWWVTRGATGPAPDPAQAAVWGLGAVARLEEPERWGGLIDADPAGGLDALCTALLHEGEERRSVRGGQVRVPRLVPAVVGGAPIALDPDRPCVVVGGLGALGSRVAGWLEEHGVRDVRVTTRRTSGAAIQADAADAHAVAGAIPDDCAAVVVAAGAAPSCAVRDLDREGLMAALSPKLAAARAAIARAPDLVVLVSSVAGLWGSRGLGAYAAANRALDALASGTEPRVLALALGPVELNGMVPADERARLADLGLPPLAPEDALELLERLWSGPSRAIALARADWARLGQALQARSPLPYLAKLAPAEDAASTDAGIAVLAAPEGQRLDLLRERVAEAAARALGHDRTGAVDRKRGFFDAGLDSLMAVQLARELQQWLGVAVDATAVFDHPTVDALAGHLLGRLTGTGDAPRRRPPRPASDAPVAVVGIGCRFPGGVTSPDALWTLLLEGRDATGPVPEGRWDAASWEGTGPGRMITSRGGYVHGLELFDAAFFGMGEREAAALDPQQRMLLETTWEALEHSGRAPGSLAGTRAGVFVGIGHSDYWRRLRDLDDAEAARHHPWSGTGNEPAFAAGRVAHLLGLRGPALSVNTACSSALVAVHLAVSALRDGSCDLALAAGTSAIVDPEGSVYLTQLGALASDGRCRAFDAAADGYGRGEGCGVVVLRRLEDAEADGDEVIGLLLGSAIGHDGAAAGLTAPSGPAQQEVIRRALDQAGVDGARVGMLEAHGTGTPLGDPIELNAAAEVLAPGRSDDRPLAIGSVKSNLGHLEAAAGIAGLIKAVLAVQRGAIPAHLHLHTPNPALRLDFPVVIPTRARPWPGPERLAGVSAFGMSGTNAHVVVGGPPQRVPEEPAPRTQHLLGLSASDTGRLAAATEALADHLDAHPELRPGDVCAAAWCRDAHPVRRVVRAGSTAELAAALRIPDARMAPPRPRVAFVCTGQGTQIRSMGLALRAGYPAFRDALDRAAGALGRSAEELLDSPTLDDTAEAQPALVALALALAAQWEAWGVRPDVVAGHSVGALAAAALAGVLTPEDAVRLAARRGALMAALPRGGAMVAVGAAQDRVLELLTEEPGVEISAVNSPFEVVLSGDAAAVERVAATAAAEGAEITRLRVSHAFHSAHMDPVVGPLADAVDALDLSPPGRTLLRSTDGRDAGPEVAAAEYWGRHARAPVRFDAVAAALVRHGIDVVVELGPHPVLLGHIGALHPDAALIATLRRGAGDEATLLDAAGAAWVHGVALDGAALSRPGRTAPLPLPPTRFQRTRHWVADPSVPPVVDPSSWICAVRWVEAPPGAPGPRPPVFARTAGPWGEALAAALEASEGAAAEIRSGVLLDLRPLDAPDGAEGAASVTRTTVELARELLAAGWARGEDRRAVVVTVGGADAGGPVRAGLGTAAGAVRGARAEADLPLELVDLDPRGDADTELLLRTLAAPPDEPVTAWRKGRRLAPRLVPASLPATPWTARADGAYLVTGATGALGQRVVTWLLESGAGAVVAVGRTAAELPPRERVTTVVADLAAPAGALAAVRAAHATGLPLRGVVHAAGAVAPAALREVDPEDDALHGAKLRAAWELAELTLQDPLELFALFSSATALLGAAGQVVYGAVNAGLDALAAELRRTGRPALAIGWGPWSEGMAAGTDWGARGARPLQPAGALAALGRLAAGTLGHAVVMDADWPAVAAARTTADPLLHRLLDGTGEAGPLATRYRAAPEAERRRLLLDAVERAVTRVLGRPVRPDARLQEAGLDSVLAVELRSVLQREVGLPLPQTLALDHPSIAALARSLGQRLGQGLGQRAADRPTEQRARREPIAIVGVGCRLPGNIRGLDELANAAWDGRDTVSVTDRWPDPRPGSYLDAIDTFDPRFFRISPREARAMDPQHRLALELAWEALEDAALPLDSLEREAAGVYLGVGHSDYEAFAAGTVEVRADRYALTGNLGSVAAGRIAHTLGLGGPCMAVDTACSSGLVAVHLACAALRDGRCTTALAGAVSLMVSPRAHLHLERIGALSADGRCRTFDADASGYGRGEGGVLFALEPLSRAEAAGHRILGVIRGSATNHDGPSGGLTVPSGPAQQAVIRAALADAGLEPEALDVVEAHGTGTPLGDPVELEALGAVFAGRARPLVVTAAKALLGHLEIAAGAAGLLHVLALLHRDSVPAHPTLERPTDRVDWATLPLQLPVAPRPWARGPRPRRAGVSAFGLSGTNAHVVVEEAPATEISTAPPPPGLMLPLSAGDRGSLEALASALARRLEPGDDAVGVCATATRGRTPLQHRAVVVAADVPGLVDGLRAVGRGAPSAVIGADAGAPRVAFLFSGQGAQHAGMGRALYAAAPAFREALDRAAVVLDEHGIDLRAALWGSGEDGLRRTALAQPALVALELALAAQWAALGVRPELVLGHSVGELAAACVAGVWTFEEALALAAWRGARMQALDPQGAMCAVRAAPEQVEALLAGAAGVSIAAYNGPAQVAISGRAEALEAAGERLAAAGLDVRPLDVSHGFHSEVVDPMLDELRQRAAELGPAPASLGVASNVTGRIERQLLASPEYWSEHARAPVRFAAGLEALRRQGIELAIELGPGATLSALAASMPGPTCLPTLVRGRHEARALMRTAGAAWTRGVAVDLAALDPHARARVSLPHTPRRAERHHLDAPAPSAERWGIRWVEVPSAPADDLPVVRVPRELPADPVAAVLVACAPVLEALRSDDDLLICTLGAQPAGSRAAEPAHAAVWGLARCAALERPGRRIALVDGDGPVGAPGEDQLAVRGGRALAPRLHRLPSHPPAEIRPDRTYLITGGLGELGRAAALGLVARGARHLVLASRSGAEGDEARTTALARLQEAGATVALCIADAADAAALDAALADMPPLAGVLHTAGIGHPREAADLSSSELEAALHAKVRGAVALAHLLGPHLDFAVFVSSAAATWGGRGQGAYAAANAWLEGHALALRARGVPATAVALGPLRRGLGDERTRAALARAGVTPMDVDAALEALWRAAASGRAHEVVADLDLSLFGALLASRGRRLLDAVRPPDPRPRRAARRGADLVGLVRSEVAALLELAPDEVPADRGFADLGVDSLMAIELRDALQGALGRDLPSTLAFDHPSVHALAAHLAGSAPHRVLAAAAASGPVAIIGAGCRFPGGARDLRSWGAVLAAGTDAVGPLPEARFGADAAGRRGALIDDVFSFDAEFFGISDREAASMDPQQRLLLEVAVEALEDAGLPPEALRDHSVGVFVGIGPSDYDALRGSAATSDPYALTGNTASAAAGRISHALGLGGPSIALDTACSSALVAVHQAVEALRAGRAALALAGGVHTLSSLRGTEHLEQLGALSSAGRCATFDAAADGYVRGEGCGLVLLRGLEEARGAGDRILGVIRGTAVNHDGRASGLTVPSGPAQEAVIAAALADAGLEPAEVDYVEAHGTGTQLGDPIELHALGAAYGARAEPLIVGSAKTNVGHLEAAAGVAGLLKVLAALAADRIPAHLHLEHPNPHVDWSELPLRIASEPVPWPRGARPRRAGISAFGLSGTNAHVLVEEAPAEDAPGPEPPVALVALSTTTAGALAPAARAWARALDEAADPHDLCFTALVGRSHRAHRLAAAAPDAATLARALRAWTDGAASAVHTGTARAGGIALLYTGQGSAHGGMALGLHAAHPGFRAALDACADHLVGHLDVPLLDALADDDALQHTRVAQPALLAVQIALTELLRSWGLEPEVVLGHSLGEVAAAWAAGMWSTADALAFAAARGAAMEAHCAPGAMVSVRAEPARIEALRAEPPHGLAVAAVNAPDEVVLSGPAAAVAAAGSELLAAGARVHRLQSGMAFHAPEMDPALADVRAAAEATSRREPELDLISTATGAAIGAVTADHWVRHAREPVLLADALRALRERNPAAVVEVGPHPQLLALAGRALPPDVALVPTLHRDGSDLLRLHDAAARLYVAGHAPDGAALYAPWPRKRTRAPTAVFSRRFLRVGPRQASGGHPILGTRIRAAGGQVVHETRLAHGDRLRLEDHVVAGRSLVPATALAELALAAGDPGDAVAALLVHAPAEVPEAGAALQIERASDAVRIHDAHGTLVADGRVERGASAPQPLDLAALRAEHTTGFGAADLYARLRDRGLAYGPAYRQLEDGWRSDGSALAPVAGTGPLAAVLDAALQLLAAVEPERTALYVPHGIDRLQLWEGGDPAWALSRLDTSGGRVRGVARVLDDGGRVLAHLEASLRPVATASAPVHVVRWSSIAPAPEDEPGAWVVLGSGTEAQEVEAALAAGGTRVARDLDATGPWAGVVCTGAFATPTATTQRAVAVARKIAVLRPRPRLVLATRGAAALPGDPPAALAQAGLSGLAAALRTELPRTHMVDLDPEGAADPSVVRAAIRDGRRAVAAIRRGEVLAARLHTEQVPPEDRGPRHVVVDRVAEGGVRIAPLALPEPGAGQVRVEVAAAGLNFRDVLTALGRYAGAAGPLGQELTGTVDAVGPGVDPGRVGQRVVAIAPGAMATHVLAEAPLAVPLPDAISAEEGATVPIALVTALYGLRDLAHVRPGQRVLVHAAAGGVGLAALQVARWLGAEVVATASPWKWPALRARGVAEPLHSRTVAFEQRLREEGGVDVVLNALTGPAIGAGLRSLRPGGVFLELGKAELWSEAQVRAVHPDATYCPYDLGGLDADALGALLTEVVEALEHGHLHPLPHRALPLDEAARACSELARARHIGKRVLRIAAPTVRGTWLVTGGSGAVGTHVAGWLKERGARVIRASRSPAADGPGEPLALDVSDRAAVARAVEALAPDLRGVVHCAGVLGEALLDDLDDERIAAAFSARVEGAIALDEATRDLPLDAFVLCSSVASHLPSAGQGAYAAASATLDALAHHRQQLGLPATSIGWGPWAGGGQADRPELRARYAALGIRPLEPEAALEAFGAVLARERSHALVLDASLAALARRDDAPAVLAAAPNPERAPHLPTGSGAITALVTRLAGQVLGRAPDAPLPPARGFFDAGMDSLTAVELGRSLARATGLDLPVTIAFEHPSVEALAEHLLTQRTVAPAATPQLGAPTDAAIAIVGMACRLPGAPDPAALWDLCVEGRIALRPVPLDRWDADALYDPARPSAPGRLYVREAGFLEAIDGFDPDAFGISTREATSLDPQQRLLLEVTWEALEDAGMPLRRLVRSRTGIYVGAADRGYLRRFHKADGLYPDAWAGSGSEVGFAAGRLAHALGLRGPTLALNTNCSTSLVATHLACQALRAGECTTALAGGVTLQLVADDTSYLCQLGALSPDSRCHTFDARANGYVRSEGCGMVVLRRLADAQRDGDRVLAVILGTAVNHDGPSAGLTVPSASGQQEVLRTALEAAGVAPSEVGYLECHGTGTPLGDPIELRAVDAVYGRDRIRPLALGALKASLGHAEIAAGVAGLIKLVQVVRHGVFPPIAGLQTPNPELPLEALHLPRIPEPWPDGPRIGAVSSFGMSGTNAHAVIAEPPRAPAAPRPEPGSGAGPPAHLLALSARSEGALRALAGAMIGAAPLPEVAYTTRTHRSHLDWRAAIVAADAQEADAALRALAGGAPLPSPWRRRPRIAFLCTGHGAQQAGWALELAECLPGFRSALDEVDALLAPRLGLPLRAILADGERCLIDPGTALPALFAVQWALAAQWARWGVRAEAAAGHSAGEVAAACIAGVLSLEDAVDVIVARGAGMAAVEEPGAMAAVHANAEITAAALEGSGGEIAGTTHPGETVIAGAPSAVEAAARALEERGVEVRRLRIAVAAHSSWVDPMLDRYEQVVAGCTLREPALELASNLTGALERAAWTDPSTWRRQVRERVRFAEEIGALAALGIDTWIELGPHPVLLGAAQRTLGDAASTGCWLPSLRRDADDGRELLGSLARLFEAGGQIDWAGFDAPWPRARAELPTYPFQRRRLWLEGDRPPWEDWLYGLQWVPTARTGHDPGPLRVCTAEAPSPAVAQLAEALPGAHSCLADVHQSARPGEALVWLADLDPDAGADAIAEQCMAAITLARTAAERGCTVWAVTRCGTSAGGPSHPASAALLSLMRTLLLEHPPLGGGTVDLDEAGGARDLAAALAAGEEHVAVRDGALLSARLLPTPAPPPGASVRGTWLVTGGLGALGRHVARWLARRGATHLVLTARTALPPREVWGELEGELATRCAAVLELEALGARVHAVAADVADPEAMAPLLAEPELRGVVHAAGSSHLTPSLELDRDTLRGVLRAKVDGACVLDDGTRDRDLDAFVLFSSVAGVWGSAEGAAYGAANAFLDALAARRRAAGLPARAIAWGHWDAGGMMSEELSTRMLRQGQLALPPDQALAALSALLAPGPEVVLARVQWEVFQRVYTAARPRPLLAGLVRGADPDRAVPELLAAPAEIDLPALVARHARHVLRLPPDAPLDASQPLLEQGLDSLMATELRTLLRADGVELPIGRLLGGPSVDELVDIARAAIAPLEPELPAPEAEAFPLLWWSHGVAIVCGAGIGAGLLLLAQALGG